MDRVDSTPNSKPKTIFIHYSVAYSNKNDIQTTISLNVSFKSQSLRWHLKREPFMVERQAYCYLAALIITLLL